MNENDLLLRLGVAVAIGLLIGLERGWRSRKETDRERAAGLRTFALSGLLGGLAGALSIQAGGLVIGLVFVGFAGAFAAFHWLEAKAEGNLSVTSVVAGLVTFLLGALAVTSNLTAAVAAGVVTVVLLALRETLHRWVASLTWDEIRAVLTLVAMTFLLLPVLPNRTVDPWHVLNPYAIWLMAILIAGISFGGYVAVKTFGDRLGVIMAAVAGGLASSTATTLTLSRIARDHPASSRLLSAGVLIAGLVMVVRVGILATLLNQSMIGALAPPLAAAALVLATGAAILLFRNTETETPHLAVRNPLELGTALKLAGFIVVVLLTSKALQAAFGNLGVLLFAGLSGLADVDAVTLSMAQGSGIAAETATRVILIAAAVNTLAKAALAGWTGGVRIGINVGSVSVLAVGCGLLTALR